MPRCQEFKTDHTQCTRNASRVAGDTHPEHLHFCTQHKRTYSNSIARDTGGVHHTAGCCYHLTRPVRRGEVAWVWCPSPAADGQILCPLHETERLDRIEIAEERLNDRLEIRGILEALLAEEPPVPWRRAVRVLTAMVDEREDIRQRVADDYFFHPRTRQLEFNDRADGWILRDYWQWAINGQVGPEPLPRAPIAALPYRHPAPPPAPVQDLARLARDSQNVHTRVVSEQTNKASLKLLTVTVPKTQSTETVLALVWLPWLYTTGVVYSSYLRVANDMHTWFNTKTCRTESDYLYRQLLRGLVAFINAEKDEGRKLEMFKRLWEESEEAVGMCCEGHITRLCNVLVGFDDDFEASVSLGELIQQKMAAIAGLDVSEEEKRKQASVFFDEHKVPDTDRAVWLDAF